MRPPFAFRQVVRTRSKTDLRRAISRQTWLANRASNALHRPAFIGAISVATFVTAIVSMVVVPRMQSRAEVVVPTVPRPDTIGLLVNMGAARLRVQQADSTLSEARTAVLIAARKREADSLAMARMMDSLGTNPVATRDSLQGYVATVDRLLARVEQAPLPSSYRAIAEIPELRADVRVRSMIDSLNDIEREREAFGAVGGVDPVFVALTTRLNEMGRVIVALAAQSRAAAVAELATMAPAPAQASEAQAVDTLPLLAVRDSAATAVQQVEAELTRRRQQSLVLDREEDRARERANAVAPPLALLAAAFVLSAVIGFGTAFFRELRNPRLANAHELERHLGVRVLSTVETTLPSAERGRRQADRAAPPYFDPSAEGYQLAYLGLATDHPALLTVTVTGDDPAISAIVACNLAAVAAEEARNTLVLDLDPRSSGSAALRARATPGITDIRNGRAQWPDVTVQAAVGRDKSVDLVPRGLGGLSGADAVALLQRDEGRLARYYDAIIVLASPEMITDGLPAALPAGDLVYCAQPTLTPLRALREELDRLRMAGAEVRGVVLWQAERPILATPRELAGRRPAAQPEPAAATV
jgi:Mrp family chromosome partitioning ATPase